MATASGSYVQHTVSGSTRKWRAQITYGSVTDVSGNPAKSQITVSACKMDLSGGSGTTMKCTKGNTTYTLSATGQTSTSPSGTFPSSDKTVNASDDWTMISSKTFIWDKTTSAQTKTISWKVQQKSASSWSGTSTASFTVTIPALASYAVSYNANGGTGTIGNQTKYYGIAITLNNGANFTRANYTLVGWNTKADGTGAHYNLGASYTGNAALTLYAEWRQNTVKMRRKINGSWVTGTVYRKVGSNWVLPHTGYVKVDGIWKRIN